MKNLLMAAAMIAGTLAFVGCKKEETMGEKLDKTVKSAEKEAAAAVKDAEKAANKAAKSAEKASDDAKKSLDDMTK